MNNELRILIIEDNEDDYLLLIRVMEKEGYKLKHKRVELPSQLEQALEEEQWDVIVSDYALPNFGGLEALEIFKSKNIDIPFILVSGTVGEDIAVDMMKSGVHDYIMKNNLKRIVPAIQRELKEVGIRKQRKKAIDSLTKREEQYRNLITSMNEGLLQVDNDDNILFVNKRLCEMFGYKNNELIGKICFEILVHPEDRKIVFEENTTRLKGVSGKYELRMLTKSGKIIWAEISGIPVIDDNGNVKGSIGLITDITNRRLAEIALKESEEKFRGLAERISDLVIISGKSNEILFVTPSIKKILGFTQEEVIGKKAEELLPVLEFIKLSSVKGGNYNIESVENFEITIPRKDGTYAIMEFTGSPIYHEDEVAGIQVIGRDITERRLAEENIRILSRAVDQSPVSIFITNTKGIIEYINPKFTVVTGYKFNEAVGKNANILKSGEEPGELYDNFWKTIISGKEWNGEFLNRNKNGELIWVSSVISPIKNENEEITHFISIMEDITKRKEMEDALKHAIETAEESSRLKSSILANVSHELRTPMTAILGITQILIEEIQEKNVNDLIKKIKKSSDRLMTTLNSILNLSELESNSSLIYFSEYNIGRQVKILLSNYENYAKERNLYFNYKIKDKDVTALVDERFMNQIIINIVDNALKYTEKGGIDIIIDSFYKDNKLYTELKVKDTGIGISEENKEIIFHEFRQASEGLARQYEGTGLGLTLAKRMIELMNGSISVESEIGKGSIFIITMPGIELKEINETKEEVSIIDFEQTVKQSTDFNGNILLVEDSSENADVIINFLDRFGNIDYAKDGWEALKMIKTKKYSLILMDINLGPGLDGVNACKKIREQQDYLNVPIVALTGYAMSSDKEKFLASGFNYYISKPFSKTLLQGEINKIIRQCYLENKN